MDKSFELNIGGRTLRLCFNMIFAEQLAKVLRTDGTPQALMAGILALNEKSSFLMSKALVHCGMLGHDYMVGYEASMDQSEVGELIAGANAKDLTDMFEAVAKNLGFDLKAEPREQPKKKAVRKKA